MSSTPRAAAFASLLLALPARAHASGEQLASTTRDAQLASTTRDAQLASTTRAAQLASTTHDAQHASTTRDAQHAPTTRAAQRTSPSRTLRGELGAHQLVAFGLPASPSIGFSPFITFRWPDTSLSLEPRVLTAVTPASERAGIALRMWMSAVSACRHHRIFSFCGVLQLGRTSVTSRKNLFTDKTPLLIAVGARAGAGWRASRYLSLHAAVELNAHVGRPEVWDVATLAWTTPLGSVITALGVTVPLTPE